MKRVPKGLKVGVFVGLGLVVLINVAVFIAIFKQPECRVMETSCGRQKQEKLDGLEAVRSVVARGLDFLLGTDSSH